MLVLVNIDRVALVNLTSGSVILKWGGLKVDDAWNITQEEFDQMYWKENGIPIPVQEGC